MSSLSKATLELALASIERDIESIVAAGQPDWRQLRDGGEVMAAAEIQEAIEEMSE